MFLSVFCLFLINLAVKSIFEKSLIVSMKLNLNASIQQQNKFKDME